MLWRKGVTVPASLTKDEFNKRLGENRQLLLLAIVEDLKQNPYFIKLKDSVPQDISADLTRLLIDMASKSVARMVDLVYKDFE